MGASFTKGFAPPLGLAGAGAGLLGLALLLYASGADLPLLRLLNGLAPTLAWPASVASELGLGMAAVLLASLGGPARARPLLLMLLAVTLGGLLVQALKYGLQMPRPAAVLGVDGLRVVGLPLLTNGMPSGHAACAAALAVLMWRPGARMNPLLVLLAGSIAASRLIVGAHWPSDVVAGVAVGLLVAGALARARPVQRMCEMVEGSMRSRSGSRVTASLLVCAAAAFWVAACEHPLGDGVHVALPALAMLAALQWWRLHPSHCARRRAAAPAAAFSHDLDGAD